MEAVKIINALKSLPKGLRKADLMEFFIEAELLDKPTLKAVVGALSEMVDDGSSAVPSVVKKTNGTKAKVETPKPIEVKVAKPAVEEEDEVDAEDNVVLDNKVENVAETSESAPVYNLFD